MTDTASRQIFAPSDHLPFRVARGVVFVGVAQGVRVSVQFLSVIIMSRLLNPSDFGVIAMVSPLIAFVTLFQGLGLSSAVANVRAITHAQLSTIFWINLGLSAGLAAFVVSLAPFVGLFYGEPAVVGLTMAMGGIILISGLASQHTALINREMRFARGGLVDAISCILALVVGVSVATVWPSPWALVASLTANALFGMLGAWWVTQWRPGPPSSIKDVTTLLRFGRGVTGFNIANFFARNLDNILIGRYVGPAELGLYDRAYKLLLLPVYQVLGPISRVLLPVLSRLADEPDRYRWAYTRAVQQILLWVIPGVVWLLVEADIVIPLLLGEQWGATVPIFRWLGLCALVQPLSATTGWLFISQHRTYEFAGWGVFVAVTSAAAFVIGLPWGALGVAAAYTISELFLRLPVVVWLVGRRGPVGTSVLCRLLVRNAVANGAATAALLLVSRNLAVSPPLELALSLCLSYAVAWCVLAAFPQGRRAFADSLSALRSLLQK